MRPDPLYVVVSGPPASGKTTLSRQLAPRLGLPLLAKDTVKQALLSVLAVPDVQTSRTVGRAAAAAVLAVAAECPGAVLEATWHRSRAVEPVRGLPGTVVEVFCRCDADTLQVRYRARSGTRGAGHFDHRREPAELWNDDTGRPLAGGWPVLEVDTAAAPDVEALARAVRAAAAQVGA